MQASLNLELITGKENSSSEGSLLTNIRAEIFKASLTALAIVNRKSRFVAHSLTIRFPWDIQGNSDSLKRNNPFLAR